jgi:hypothetical protein
MTCLPPSPAKILPTREILRRFVECYIANPGSINPVTTRAKRKARHHIPLLIIGTVTILLAA